VIRAKLDQGLSAQRIYQDLASEHGAQVSYDSVKRFVRRLGTRTPLPFRRMECAAGEEAQVDFGTGAPLVGPEGKRWKSYVFRIVLSHSRKAYSEATRTQKTEDFLGGLENAFRHFGGVPRTLVIDNLRAAVAHPDWFDPELTPKVQAFCRHYGTVILPTKVYTPRHKGKVEAGVKYVKRNGLQGRTFESLEAENRFLQDWEANVADRRIHGTTKRQVGQVFEEVERAALLPLPRERFPQFHEARRKVNRDEHVEVAKAYYSAPPEYLGREVWVRWDARLVRIFNQHFEQIALHVRHEQGRFSTQAAHVAPEKISGLERGAAWLLNQVSAVGPQTRQRGRSDAPCPRHRRHARAPRTAGLDQEAAQRSLGKSLRNRALPRLLPPAHDPAVAPAWRRPATTAPVPGGAPDHSALGGVWGGGGSGAPSPGRVLLRKRRFGEVGPHSRQRRRRARNQPAVARLGRVGCAEGGRSLAGRRRSRLRSTRHARCAACSFPFPSLFGEP
jgi:transposase